METDSNYCVGFLRLLRQWEEGGLATLWGRPFPSPRGGWELYTQRWAGLVWDRGTSKGLLSNRRAREKVQQPQQEISLPG